MRQQHTDNYTYMKENTLQHATINIIIRKGNTGYKTLSVYLSDCISHDETSASHENNKPIEF